MQKTHFKRRNTDETSAGSKNLSNKIFGNYFFFKNFYMAD